MHCRIGCLPKKSSISLSTKNRSPNQRASKYIIATSSAVYGRSQQVFSLLGISLLRGIDRIISIAFTITGSKKNLTSDKSSQVCRLKSLNLGFYLHSSRGK